MTVREIGCCGAYCRTCKAAVSLGGACAGCKLGYGEGGRDIDKAKCRMKLCCFRDKKLETCADCAEYETCEIIREFYGKNGYKYGKYRQSIEFIRSSGYDVFIEKADSWKGPYGRLD